MSAFFKNILFSINSALASLFYDTSYSSYANISIQNGHIVDFVECMLVNFSSLLFIIFTVVLFYKSLVWLFNLFGG